MNIWRDLQRLIARQGISCWNWGPSAGSPGWGRVVSVLRVMGGVRCSGCRLVITRF